MGRRRRADGYAHRRRRLARFAAAAGASGRAAATPAYGAALFHATFAAALAAWVRAASAAHRRRALSRWAAVVSSTAILAADLRDPPGGRGTGGVRGAGRRRPTTAGSRWGRRAVALQRAGGLQHVPRDSRLVVRRLEAEDGRRGRRRGAKRVSLALVPTARSVGDYVIVHAGYAHQPSRPRGSAAHAGAVCRMRQQTSERSLR